MNKKGFTIVELIATIVIILILGLIVTPKVMDIVNTNRIKGYKEIERRLEEAAGKYLAENYVDSSATFVIIKKNQLIEGKYIDEIYDLKDKSVCDAYVIVSGLNHVSKFSANLQCSQYKSKLKTTVHILDLYNDDELRSLNGLEKTSDGNIRYTGSSPSNYVEFGNTNELWRIIGIFEVPTASGKTEKLMKIVRDESIGSYSWDSSIGDNSGTHEEGEVNDGYGINQWGTSTYTNGSTYEGADLMRELNTLYLNQISGTCYNDVNNASTTCDFTNSGINVIYRSMIENVVWNIALVKGSASGRTGQSALTAYNAERSSAIELRCSSSSYCTDTVERTSIWEGKVGLIYPSDYGYASTNEDCRNWINADKEDTKYCKNDNWLHNDTRYWTLSPYNSSIANYSVFNVKAEGFVNSSSARYSSGVIPSVYLKSNIYIVSGEGTQSSPYKLSVNG